MITGIWEAAPFLQINTRKNTHMKIILAVVIFLVICFLYAHRYVILARIKHEPMPKAPRWHTWVKPEDRNK